jgi:hypothetical protein
MHYVSMEVFRVSFYLISQYGPKGVISQAENPNFNIYTTRQGNRVLVTRRRGELVIRECLVQGCLTQKRKP